MSEEASPPTSQETQPESDYHQVPSEEAAPAMATSEAEVPIASEIERSQAQETEISVQKIPIIETTAQVQPIESSQVEDRVQPDRQSESQAEEKMETLVAPSRNVGGDSSDDDDDHQPTRKVIIDEDEDDAPLTQKPIVQVIEAPKGLPYEDHNYGFGRPDSRTTRQVADENNEPFPVIGGLASYLGEEENHSPPAQPVSRPITRIQQAVPAHLTGHDYTTTRTIGPQGQTVHTIRMTAPRASSIGAPILTSYRPVRETTIPIQTIQARRIMGPSTAPTLITRRPTLIRARRDGVPEQVTPGHVIVRTTPDGIRLRAPTQQGIALGSPMYHSTPITGDPMRLANAGAPAPFITGQRGTRLTLRGRPTGPSHPVVRTRLTRDQTQSGQLVIGPDGLIPQAQIITTTTNMPAPTQVTYSPRKLVPINAAGGGTPQQVYVSQLRRPPSASPTKLVSRGGLTYRQVAPSPAKGKASDSTLVNVVDEEELQNMQFLQQQEQKIQEKRPEGQAPVESQSQEHDQQRDRKISGESPTSAAIELTRLRTSNVPIASGVAEINQQVDTGAKLSEDGRTMVTMRPVMVRSRGRPSVRASFINAQETQGIRIAQPYVQQHGQRIPLSRTTNVNLDSLRSLDYTRPYERFRSMPGTRIVSRGQIQQGNFAGQPVTVIRGSPTQIQGVQPHSDHEYVQPLHAPPETQQVSQTQAHEPEGLTSQQVVSTTSQPPIAPGAQIQVQPQTQHFRVIDYSSRSPPPRPLTPGTRVVHLQPYSPTRQRISSSGLEDLAQVSQQMQPQVIQPGQHAVYPIPMTSPPRQYTRAISSYSYGQRPSSPPKQQFQNEPTYIQPQVMQHIPHPASDHQPHPPQDFLAGDHHDQQLPSITAGAMQEQPQTVPEDYNPEQLMYQQGEEQKLPTDIGQENRHELPEPKEDEDSDEDEWKDQEYTNRCLCGLTHNDEFMVECDRCNVWQHGICMGLTPKTVGKSYFCEQCEPRPLKHTQEEAVAIQEKYLERKRKWKERNKKLKQQRLARKEAKTKKSQEPEPIKKRTTSVGSTKAAKKFNVVIENEYTRRMKTFMNATPNKGDINLPTTLPEAEASARQMYVAPNVEGLVATRDIPQSEPFMEITGKIGFQDEIHGREKPGSIQNFIIMYTGFGENEEMAVAIDARKIGSPARFARRSCHPNTQIRHVIRYGKLHLFLVASEDIDFGIEITIPFDYDWKRSSSELSCACGGEENCPIRDFNNALPKEFREEKVNGVVSPRKALLTKKPEKVTQKPKSLVKTEGRGMPKAVSVSLIQKKKFKKGGKPTTKGKIKMRPKRSESRSTKAEEPKVDVKVDEEEKLEPPSTRAARSKAIAVKEEEPKQEKESRPKSPETRRSQRTRTSSITGPTTTTGAPPKEEPILEKEERRVSARKSALVPEKLSTPENEKPDRELQRALEQIRRIEESERKKREKDEAKKKTTPKSDQKSKRGSSEKPSPKEKEAKRTSPRKAPESKENLKRGGKKTEEELGEFTSVADRLRRTSKGKADEVKVEDDEKKTLETLRRSGRLTSTSKLNEEETQKIGKDSPFSVPKESPSKRRRGEDHQMTQVEAAKLLTEMAQASLGVSTIYDDKTAPTVPQISPTADVLTQIRRLAIAEAPLRSSDFELKDEFSLLDEPSTSAAIQKGSSRSLLQKALATSMRSSQRILPKVGGSRPKTPPPTPRTPPLPEPEPPKKTKKLSLEEYKKRKIASQNNELLTPTKPDIPKPTTPAETNTPQEKASPNRRSFIPSMDSKAIEKAENLINMVVPPQLTQQPTSIQDLKKKILGGRRGAKSPPPPELASTSSEPLTKKARLTPPPLPPNLETNTPDRSNSHEPSGHPPPPQPASATSVPHRMSLEERLIAEFGIGVDDSNTMLPPPPLPPHVTRNIPLNDTRPPPPPPPPLSARPQRGLPNAVFRQGPTGIVFDINEIEPAQVHPVTRSRQPNHRYARM